MGDWETGWQDVGDSQDFPYDEFGNYGNNTWYSRVKGCQWYQRQETCVPVNDALVADSTLCACICSPCGVSITDPTAPWQSDPPQQPAAEDDLPQEATVSTTTQ